MADFGAVNWLKIVSPGGQTLLVLRNQDPSSTTIGMCRGEQTKDAKKRRCNGEEEMTGE